jgi:hypothetical protein
VPIVEDGIRYGSKQCGRRMRTGGVQNEETILARSSEKRFVVLAKEGPVLSKGPLLIPGGLAYAEKVAT